MPAFDTPEPIAIAIEVGVAEIRIAGGERSDTVVDIRPADPARKADVAAAEQTKVEYADGVLRITGPKSWRRAALRGAGEGIHVLVQAPSGSSLRGQVGAGTLHATGRLGECRVVSGAGDIRLEEAGRLTLKAAAGDITVGRAAGHCDVATASGTVALGAVDGAAAVKNSNGDITVGDITGDLRIVAVNGKVSVDRAGSTVAVKTANGDIRLGEVGRGAAVAHTAYGRIDIGVRDGVAAWLDLHTAFGKVHNGLDAAERPAPGDDVVEVKARTAYGDITIRRAAVSAQAR